MKKKLFVLLSLAVVPALLVTLTISCSDSSSPGGNNVAVLLTDAPIDLTGVIAVNVTLTGISLHAEGDDGESTKLSLTAGDDMVVNLLDYQDGQVVLIATGEVPDGTYSKIRMHVSRAELVRDDDGDPETPEIVEEIFNPSSKVDVPVAFSLTNGEDMEITLDFDAALSVQVNETSGQHPYILRPVINVAGMN